MTVVAQPPGLCAELRRRRVEQLSDVHARSLRLAPRDDLAHIRRRQGQTAVLDSQGTMHCIEPAQTRNVISQLRRGTVEYCVLALLRDGERYGFELVRELAGVDGLVTSEGTIYPLLTRLRKDELVTTFWRESDSGPPRRYYRLTDAGREALVDFTKEWSRFRDSVDAILTRKDTP